MKNKIELWCPWAMKVEPKLPTLGQYAEGYPLGAVVHYTAGAYGLSELDQARKERMAYFLIDNKGNVHQGFPLDRWGQHAGDSSYEGLKGNVSRHLVGIEVDCAGILKPDGKGNFRTWWNALIEHDHVRVVTKQDNRKSGAYHIFLPEQETALRRLLLWLKGNNPEVFNLELVVGHDEVAPTRKLDPGGSLSMTMPSFRDALIRDWLVREEQLAQCLPAFDTIPA